jgi:hypothetical protein
VAAVVTPEQSSSTPAGPPAERAARTYDGQGLTAAGVAVVVLAVSLVGMLVDAFTGGGIGWLFGGCFVASSGYAASQVRRRDLAWAVIDPPLVFALLVVVYAVATKTGDLLTKVVAGLNGLLDYGPMLWLGTGLAAAVVAYRVWSFRRAQRP